MADQSSQAPPPHIGIQQARPLAEGTGDPPGSWAGRPGADDASYTVLSGLA